MKSTDIFKQTIQDYLDHRIEVDILFAESYNKPGKNIDDCITYILNTVKESGCNGFTDEEVFSMAVHYYDEESIEIGNKIDMSVVVNHAVELTEEEKVEAREKAIKKVQEDAYQAMKRKSTPQKPKEKEVFVQQNLFG